jgi:putative two-component system response regulator
VLAVDDHDDNLLVLQELLDTEYEVISALSGKEALRIAPLVRPDIVLLDVLMPGMDGISTCRQLRAMPEMRNSRIVMLSAKNCVQDRLAAYDVGAVDFIAKPFDHEEVTAKVKAWMGMVQRAQLDEIWHEAELARMAIGSAMLKLASFRDTETGDHLYRVRWYAQCLALQLASAGPYKQQIDAQFLEDLYRATPLHDIGKVAIPDAILRKPGPFTREEFEVMKTHTTIGSELLRVAATNLPAASYLNMAASIARHHHERFDGTGYPDGLSNTEIPLPARILCVADVFDALTTKRVYKDAVSVAQATRIILDENGMHFDPVVIEAFRSRLEEFNDAQRLCLFELAEPEDMLAAAVLN